MAARRTAQGRVELGSPPNPAPDVPDGERAAMVADLRAQERGPTPPGTSGLLAPGIVQVAVDGDVLVFLPGELLPGWVAELMERQHPARDRHGVYHLRGKR